MLSLGLFFVVLLFFFKFTANCSADRMSWDRLVIVFF